MRYHPTIVTTLGALLTLSLLGCAEGESRESSGEEAVVYGAPTGTASLVPAGSSMTFTVDETVTSGEAKAGDSFTATLASDVRGEDGSVLVPAGTRSRWVVTESDRDGGPDGEALLAFRLRSLDLGGRRVPVEATVTETEIARTPGDSGTETAAKVAVGAAAGAIIGQILGADSESTLKGAGVGATVGTVVALTTRDGEARLEAGSVITVRLEDDVRTR